jgi:hypothetical protein
VIWRFSKLIGAITRFFFQSHLLRRQKTPGLKVLVGRVEFDLEGDVWGAPHASDNAEFALGELKFRDVLGQDHAVVDVRDTH